MKKPQIYWDSSAFLAWLKPEKDRRHACKEVLRAAEEGKIEIITSAVTLTEVIKPGKGNKALSESDEEKVQNFFKQPYILIHSLHRYVAEEARRLIWQHSKLQPKDAIHLATAASIERCREIHSFDSDFLDLDGGLGDPPMRIVTPQMPQRTLDLSTADPPPEGDDLEVN